MVRTRLIPGHRALLNHNDMPTAILPWSGKGAASPSAPWTKLLTHWSVQSPFHDVGTRPIVIGRSTVEQRLGRSCIPSQTACSLYPHWIASCAWPGPWECSSHHAGSSGHIKGVRLGH
jgi:hypothetical protein